MGLVLLEPFERRRARHGFKATHAARHGGLGDDLHETDFAGVGHMGAAAEFDAEPRHRHHAHALAVLLAEEGHGPSSESFVNGHLVRLGAGGVERLVVHEPFDLRELLGLDGREVGEVEAQALIVHDAARLLHMGAQHFAEGRVEQVRGRVVSADARAALGVHGRVNGHAFF